MFALVTDQEAIDRYFPARGAGNSVMDLTEYVGFLSGLEVGQAFEVTPGEGETGRALKRRLTLAGKSLGVRVQYSKRAENDAVIGRVLEPKTAK